MTNHISCLNNIFNYYCNYKNINGIGAKQMRCMPNGINLLDAFYYQFAYSKINITKEKIIEDINYNNNTNFKRFAFDAKASNIPVQIYRNIYTDIVNLFNSTFSNPNTEKCIAVDGTYNLNDDYK